MGSSGRPIMNGSTTTNTLPARVNGGVATGPTGRHFKPFDHRRMNPMAEIQENPYPNEDPIYASGRSPSENLIVHKSTHLPHMPAEVRHTNYNGMPLQSQRIMPQMVNPHIIEHRDSANFSMASSDSG